ncbi:MAG TPA: hypothetical protein VEK57_31780 [Thermoanaerobaculia bacterium]|nr:hypothetical protein [Thermoanaerobaculia bacterium]
MRRKPDLIVPIRDRRQRKRYLTLKNFGIAVAGLAVLFIGVTIRSELRGPDGSSSYGRLLQRELPVVEQKPLEVVQEAPPAVGDETHADPMLVAPMVRGQWLHADTTTDGGLTNVQPMPRAEASVASGETKVAIVGGPGGVNIVKQERRKPVLAGGFGR